MKTWLIQGFFCEDRQLHVTRPHPENEAPVMVNARTCQGMFSGVIGPDESCPSRLIGRMTDGYGYSFLTEITIGGEEFKFRKKYDGRQDLIYYEFRLVNGVWIGTYEGKAVERGGATCILTDASKQLLVPPVFAY